jgi:glycosyltransferase involved in cell wall biosynthesis
MARADDGGACAEVGKLIVVFHRLGPYHFARLKAVGRVFPTVGLELSCADDTYAWDFIEGEDGFQRITLFEDKDSRTQPAAEIVRRIRAALEDCNPATVVVPGWADAGALAALEWCVKRQVPAVIMSESTEWDEARVPWKEAIKERVVRMCSAGFVGGRPHAEYLVRLGMPRKHVFLGYDAVDNDYFRRKAEEARELEAGVRTKCGLPERFFLASARFVEKKNLARLIEAYGLYRKKAGGAERKKEVWSLVLLGDGALKSDLCRLISDLSLQDCVLMPGFKQYDELPVYYGLASAFIHASTVEQWGLVVNEAMASGLPVLVSNRCGCAADLVREGVNGFTFDPDSVEQIAALMCRVSWDGTREGEQNRGRVDHGLIPLTVHREAMGRASREIIAGWGPERFADGLRRAVETAIDGQIPRPRVFDRMLLRMLIARGGA